MSEATHGAPVIGDGGLPVGGEEHASSQEELDNFAAAVAAMGGTPAADTPEPAKADPPAKTPAAEEPAKAAPRRRTTTRRRTAPGG